MKVYRQIALVGLSTVLMGACIFNRGGDEANQNEDLSLDGVSEERVNQFLQENNITLPEGSSRVNLQDATGGSATGVVSTTSEESAANTEVHVLAALPDPGSDTYVAWAVTGEERVVLGQLRPGKGGFMIQAALPAAAAGASGYVVSRESSIGDAPTNIVLQGTLSE